MNTSANMKRTRSRSLRFGVNEELYNELCKARVLIGLEECMIRV